MEHHIPLITTLAAGFGVALVLGFLAEKMRIPALVGYLLAGIVLGPSTPGFAADAHIAHQLSEVGIMLLMFGVGLHFSPEDLLAVRRVAVPGAVVQMITVSAIGALIAHTWGWPAGGALVFGISLACASTVVLLKSLERRNLLNTVNGRISVGWLVVQDLLAVIVLVMVPVLARTGAASSDGTPIWVPIMQTLLQVAAFIALMLVVGKRLLPKMLWHVASTGSRELFTLSVVAAAIGIAYGASALFSASFALGAFFAGTVMRESEFSHRAAEESLPLRDAFSVLFFVSVGMSFNPYILIEHPWQVLVVVVIAVAINVSVSLAVVLALRYPLGTALAVAVSLGQIGEFSIILSGLGVSTGLLDATGMSLVLSGVLISIAINSLLFSAVEPLHKWALSVSALARRLEHQIDPFRELPMNTDQKYLAGQVVLIGYGRVGRRIGRALRDHDIPYVVIELSRDYVDDLRRNGIPAVAGDAGDAGVLIQAHVMKASMLIVATPDPLNVRQIADVAKTLNPGIEVVLRTHSEDESSMLRKDAVGTVFFGEEELARGMSQHILSRFERSPARD